MESESLASESMHWVLDMTFREYESPIGKGQGQLAFNVMIKMAMAFYKQDESKSDCMAAKKKMVGLMNTAQPCLKAGLKCVSCA